jgi:hypothetical protein
MHKFVVELAKTAHIPTNSGKLGGKVETLKKLKTKGDYGIFPTNKPSFIVSLYIAIPRLIDGGVMTHKHFVEDYNLKCEGLNPKQVRVPRDVNLKDISKFFGPIINKNGCSYVHSNDLEFIKMVKSLWMTIHGQCKDGNQICGHRFILEIKIIVAFDFNNGMDVVTTLTLGL